MSASVPVLNLVLRLRAKRSGKGWMAHCPAHQDHKPSLSLDEGADGRALVKCHAGCTLDAVLAALGMTRRDLFSQNGTTDSVRPSTTQTDVNGRTLTFEWESCVEAFTYKHIKRLAEWRGYSVELCSWLKERGLVGVYDGGIGFPVHDRAGKVVACHYRAKNGEAWFYYPKGRSTRPLVIGELHAGKTVHVFESQWDAFAFMDVSGERSGIIITRGAGNGALIAGFVPAGATVYAWKQNDELKNGKRAGDEWLKDVAAQAGTKILRVKTPERFKDLNDWTRAGATADELLAAMMNAEIVREPERPLIEFRSPLQLKNFTPPPGIVLVGDCHIVKGSTFVIGGPPGVGKSRSSVALAVAAATCRDWFGLRVHRKLRVMIIQAENGEFRLSKEFRDLDCEALDEYVRVCPPPPFGLCFQRDDFRAQLAKEIREFKPDVIILDPWNAAARDDKQKDYLDTFELIRRIIPAGDNAPALGIVAHTRKPRAEERATGRALLNLLAGSYVLGSVPRTVFVMQAGSDDTEDNRIVWTCCKNNDGELGARSAWERRNGLFVPVSEFNWETFDNPHTDDRVTITAEDLAEIFENGEKQLRKAEAAKALEILTGAGRTACYSALKSDGRFGKHLRVTRGLLIWKA